jgi:DNA segregation ATPase FtsK/SpoIIIE, S-DNA-T family
MATQSTRKPAVKKATSPQTKLKHATELTMVQYEIIVISVLAISLFLMICVYFNSGGIIGDFITRLFFGVFGVGAWILPVALFIATFIKVFNKGNQRLNIKLRLLFVSIIFISVAAHVMAVEYPQIHYKLSGKMAAFASLSNYYQISASHRLGGGFIGALLGDLFLLALGKVGTSFVLIIIFILLTIAITEQSFLVLVKGILNALVASAKKGAVLIGEKSVQLKEQRIEQLNEQSKEQSKEQTKQIKQTKQPKELKQTKELTVFVEEPPKLATKESKSKHNFIASLFKSTLNEEFDLEKQIEAKEAQEALQKEATFSALFEEADQMTEARMQQSNHVMSSFESEVDINPPFEAIEVDALTGTPDYLPSEFLGTEIKELDPVAKKQENIDIKHEKILVEQEVIKEIMKMEIPYKKPPLELLKPNPNASKPSDTQYLKERAKKLEDTLASFGVGAKVVDISVGPTVTRYELQPDQGVKVSKIVNLADDIALNLAASGIRIEAPIPGKSAVGIEVPNKDVSSVYLREVIDSKEFDHFTSKVAFALGKDISGKVIVTDIARMPHLLIAGATGSGKSICVNALITSILYKASPEEVKLLMIDPKMVELSVYNGIPHLLIPVVTDAKKAAGALNWAVQEMLERYKMFAAVNVRDMKSYNQVAEDEEDMKKLPQIVIIVDELADLMVVASHEVEEAICRLAQMARAAGLHLIIATQRPSVDVITGLIKANIPSRIAFNVSSGIDSRTIIDMNGAEKLLGKGDMLFYPVGLSKPLRVQGAFISDKEVENIVTFLKNRKREEYDEKIMKQLDRSVSEDTASSEEFDPIFEEALALCVDKQKASASMIQRVFRVGYNRAARILDQLEGAGYVSEDEGSKPRRVLLTKHEFEALKEKANASGEVSENQVIDNALQHSQTIN